MINPKKVGSPELEHDFLNVNGIVSATECTGLIQTPAVTNDEAESYQEIYPVPLQAQATKKDSKNGRREK